MEGSGKGSSFVISSVVINTLIGFRSVTQVHCDCLQDNNLKVLLLIFVEVSFKDRKRR